MNVLKSIVGALLLCVPLAVWSAETVRISKVRLYLDEAEFLWTASGVERIDEGTAPVVLRHETIISFLGFKPDQAVAEDELADRCQKAEWRLKDSGYFYDASVLIVPPKLNPAERTIIVTLRSGFFMRYGGGNAWGLFGKVALGGERASVYAYAGYNRNGIRYMHSRVGGVPLALGGRLFYYGPGDYAGKYEEQGKGNRFEGALTAGWYVSPDLLLGSDVALDGFGFDSSGLVSLQPFAAYRTSITPGTGSVGGFGARAFWYPKFEVTKYEGNAFMNIGAGERIVFALSGSGGYSPSDLPVYAGFDLYYTDDRNVRSGYSIDELTASDYVLGSAEFRYTVLKFRIASTFDCAVQAFAFTDLARTVASVEGTEQDVLDAYGAGLRVLFDNPVFAYFTFAYGMNHEGEGRFLFCGTAGY